MSVNVIIFKSMQPSHFKSTEFMFVIGFSDEFNLIILSVNAAKSIQVSRLYVGHWVSG